MRYKVYLLTEKGDRAYLKRQNDELVFDFSGDFDYITKDEFELVEKITLNGKNASKGTVELLDNKGEPYFECNLTSRLDNLKFILLPKLYTESLEEPDVDQKVYEVYKIQSISAFGTVGIGEIGGFVGSYDCLSPYDNCFIFGDSVVHGSFVQENAIVTNSFVLNGSIISGDSIVYADSVVVNSKLRGNCMVECGSTVIDSELSEVRLYSATVTKSMLNECKVYLSDVNNSILDGDVSLDEDVYFNNNFGFTKVTNFAMSGINLTFNYDVDLGYMVTDNFFKAYLMVSDYIEWLKEELASNPEVYAKSNVNFDKVIKHFNTFLATLVD